jgi:DNA-binding transcriptional MerR regulator
MENIYSRQQVIELSGLSSGQLSRLDKSEIVKPTKLGSESHPVVLYSLSQIWELKTIAALRQKLSMQEIKKVVEYLRENNFDPTLFGKFLVFCNDKLYWITSDELGEAIVELSGKNKGQVVLKAVHPIGDVISDLQQELERRQSQTPRKSSRKKSVTDA